MSIVAVNAKYAEVLGHDIEKFSEYLLYISFLDFSSLRCLCVLARYKSSINCVASVA
jgi:hypothetical protein